MGLFEAIWEALKSAWEYIKKLVLKIVNFAKNIVSWFQEPTRIKKLQENKDIIAVAIKEKLDSGEYNVVNCLFDKSEGTLVDEDVDALIIEAEDVDKRTKVEFGDKDMIEIR